MAVKGPLDIRFLGGATSDALVEMAKEKRPIQKALEDGGFKLGAGSLLGVSAGPSLSAFKMSEAPSIIITGEGLLGRGHVGPINKIPNTSEMAPLALVISALLPRPARLIFAELAEVGAKIAAGKIIKGSVSMSPQKTQGQDDDDPDGRAVTQRIEALIIPGGKTQTDLTTQSALFTEWLEKIRSIAHGSDQGGFGDVHRHSPSASAGVLEGRVTIHFDLKTGKIAERQERGTGSVTFSYVANSPTAGFELIGGGIPSTASADVAQIIRSLVGQPIFFVPTGDEASPHLQLSPAKGGIEILQAFDPRIAEQNERDVEEALKKISSAGITVAGISATQEGLLAYDLVRIGVLPNGRFSGIAHQVTNTARGTLRTVGSVTSHYVDVVFYEGAPIDIGDVSLLDTTEKDAVQTWYNSGKNAVARKRFWDKFPFAYSPAHKSRYRQPLGTNALSDVFSPGFRGRYRVLNAAMNQLARGDTEVPVDPNDVVYADQLLKPGAIMEASPEQPIFIGQHLFATAQAGSETFLLHLDPVGNVTQTVIRGPVSIGSAQDNDIAIAGAPYVARLFPFNEGRIALWVYPKELNHPPSAPEPRRDMGGLGLTEGSFRWIVFINTAPLNDAEQRLTDILNHYYSDPASTTLELLDKELTKAEQNPFINEKSTKQMRRFLHTDVEKEGIESSTCIRHIEGRNASSLDPQLILTDFNPTGKVPDVSYPLPQGNQSVVISLYGRDIKTTPYPEKQKLSIHQQGSAFFLNTNANGYIVIERDGKFLTLPEQISFRLLSEDKIYHKPTGAPLSLIGEVYIP